MGWNNLQIKGDSRFLKGVRDGSWVYFVHSYRTVPRQRKIVVATSDYGVSVPAVIERDNLIGVQFHPEKSGDVGSIMIRNFLKICDSSEST
jgi:glutamine amidotransferase